MANQQLVDYIVSLHASTYSNDTIKHILLEVGWPDAEVNDAFKVADVTRREIKPSIDKTVAIQVLAVILLIMGGSTIIFAKTHVLTGELSLGMSAPFVAQRPVAKRSDVTVLEESAPIRRPAVPVVLPYVPPVAVPTSTSTTPVVSMTPPQVPLPSVPPPTTVSKTANVINKTPPKSISFSEPIMGSPSTNRFIGSSRPDNCDAKLGADRDACYHALAFASDDMRSCSRVRDSGLFADCMLHFAISRKDKLVCQSIAQSEICFAGYAQALKDPKACAHITSVKPRAQCFANAR